MTKNAHSYSEAMPLWSTSRKLLTIMKLVTIILTALSLQVAANSVGQQVVNYSAKNKPLKEVLKEVGEQTGYYFFYRPADIEGTTSITIEAKDLSIDDFLKLCLRGQNLSFFVKGKTIVIEKSKIGQLNKQEELVTTLKASAVKDISGVVMNSRGEPLGGASVTLKLSGRSTITDAGGKFAFKKVMSNEIITVSFVGYKDYSEDVGLKDKFTLLIPFADNKLDEVVVEAYGVTTDKLRTSNIGKISAVEISRQPVMNILEILQGQVAGASVTHTSGYAGAPIKVEIRGRNNINPDIPSDPLYIIDGVPLTIIDVSGTSNYMNGSRGLVQTGVGSPANGLSPFFAINPGDIESLEVLKDADATAIYGSRGAGGVILITTKKGKATKTKYDFDLSQGASKVTTRYDFLNTPQYVAMRKEAFGNDGITPDASNAPDLIIWDTTKYTDWQNLLWGGSGSTTIGQGTISGGDTRTTFRLSAGYNRETDVLTVSGADQRGTLSLNINHKSLNQKFSLGFNSMFSYHAGNAIFLAGGGLYTPNSPAVFKDNGELNYSGWAPYDFIYPFGTLKNKYKSRTLFINTNLTLGYEIIKGLNFKTLIGFGNSNTDQVALTTIASQNPVNNPKGNAQFGSTKTNNIIIEPQIEYQKFIKNHKVNVLIGGSKQYSNTDGQTTGGSGYTNDALLSSINNSLVKTVRNNFGEYKYASLFARIGYNYKNKYLLTLNGRRDGTSRFGPGRQFGNFGSVGGAWILSEEKWFKKSGTIFSFAKLRASYGITGDDKIGDYGFLNLWGYGLFTYNGLLPLNLERHYDSLLNWGSTRKAELGITLGFLNNGINLEVSVYRNRSNNQLVPFPTPGYTGFPSVTTNSPANVQNFGVETVLKAYLMRERPFKLSFSLNIAANRNKLLSYPNIEQSPYASRFVVGQPLNIFHLLHYTGVDPENGTYTFTDKNKDGNITPSSSKPGVNDDRYVYNLTPKYEGGLTTVLSFKNIEFSFLLYFKKQQGRSAYYESIPGADISNIPLEVYNNRWKQPGDVSKFAKLTTQPFDPSFTNFGFSDGIYQDASFIRLQNATLAYSLGSNLLKKIGVDNVKFMMRAQNLFVITKYPGVDPEIQTFGALPLRRTITLGVSTNF